MDGLNLFLKSKKAQPTAAPNAALPPENIWVLLRKTKEKIARMGDNSAKSCNLVPEVGLEPTKACAERFTVSCHCH